MASAQGVITALAPAKVNLFLVLTGRRGDGYHTLATCFQTLDYGDEVSVALHPGDGIELACEGIPVDVEPELNLAWRAAVAYLAAAGSGQGCSIRLVKRVPPMTGLGGGSSDAATVLALLDELNDHRLGLDGLRRVASSLGADVPYLLTGGTAVGEGIGEILRDVRELTGGAFVIVIPPVGLSTAEVYRKASLSLTEKGLDVTLLTLEEDVVEASRRLGNDLTDAACAIEPSLENVRRQVAAIQPDLGGMSGSGSSFFAYFHDAERATSAARTLQVLGRTVIARPLGRDELRRVRQAG